MGHRARFKPRANAASKPASPSVPRGAERVWLAWRELDATRPSGFSGVEAITHREIEAYGRNVDDPLEPWEVRALVAIDRRFRAIMAEDSPPPVTTGG